MAIRKPRTAPHSLQELLTEKLVCLDLDISRWTGMIHLNEGGRIRVLKVYPQKGMRFISKLRHSVLDRWLCRCGIQYMGKWIIPASQIYTTEHLFNELKEEFQEGVDCIRRNYEYEKKAWQRREPKYARLVDDPRFDCEEVMAKFRFDWYFYSMMPTMAGNTVMRGRFDELVGRIDQALYEDVARMADKLWDRIFSWRESITPRVIDPLRFIKSKLDGFHFLNPTIAATVRLMDTAMVEVPFKPNVYLEPALHQMLNNLVWILKDHRLCLKTSGMIEEGHNPRLILSDLTPRKADLRVEAHLDTH